MALTSHRSIMKATKSWVTRTLITIRGRLKRSKVKVTSSRRTDYQSFRRKKHRQANRTRRQEKTCQSNKLILQTKLAGGMMNQIIQIKRPWVLATRSQARSPSFSWRRYLQNNFIKKDWMSWPRIWLKTMTWRYRNTKAIWFRLSVSGHRVKLK